MILNFGIVTIQPNFLLRLGLHGNWFEHSSTTTIHQCLATFSQPRVMNLDVQTQLKQQSGTKMEKMKKGTNKKEKNSKT